MMNPVLIPSAGGAVDPALEGRVATVEADISNLKQGKATTASVTAVSNRVKVFEDLPVGQITIMHPEAGHASIDAACLAARNMRRWSSGSMPIVSVAPGTYAENFDSNGVRVVARSFPAEIVPSSYIYTNNNSRNYAVQFTVPAGHGCVAGDSVALRRTLAPTNNDEARGFGDCIVTASTATTVTVRFTGNGQLAGSAAAFRLYRYPVQNKRSEPLQFDGTVSGFDGVGFSPQGDPTVWGAIELWMMRNGARVILPGGLNSVPSFRPSIGFANANVGVRMDRGCSIVGGRISLGSCRYENIVLSTGSELDLVSLVSSHGGQNVATYDGARVNVQNFTYDATNIVVAGGMDFGFYNICSSSIALRSGTVRGNGIDIGSYVNAPGSVTGIGGLDTASPPLNSTGNRGASLWS